MQYGIMGFASNYIIGYIVNDLIFFKVTEDSEWLGGLLAKSLGIGGSAAMLLVAVAVVIVRWRAERGTD